MDGVNTAADSDHSMTWEDFFGSTSDLTPTLIGIYDSLRVPSEKSPPEVSRFDLTAKDTRNEPPLKTEGKDKMIEDKTKPPKETTTKIPTGVKQPGPNKSTLYTIRTKLESDNNGAKESVKCISSETKSNVRTKLDGRVVEASTFDTLSPNVKRMISSATETSTLKFKKSVTGARASVRGHRSNIPLVGATSKITQSGVDILPSVEIYDQPAPKTVNKDSTDEETSPKESPVKMVKPNFKLNVQETYDVPTNNRPAIYDVPSATNKTAFESLSLPYIDQSIELNITTNDREFDTKVKSKDNTPLSPKPSPQRSPVKLSSSLNGTHSLNRKEYNSKTPSPAKQLNKSEPYPDAVGSTGNLKSCAVPEKEALRLNPPTVEVTRPLSMSSIASSSSTSSSGVQNKGGVNSAYLASIESLDDHSDVDMTSANGSSNFMNNAGVLNKGASEESADLPRGPSEEAPGLTQLERVCAEIVHTENVYVRDLQQVVEGYLHVWRQEDMFSEEELAELFNNIEDIYNFNSTLCQELNLCQLDATSIARCFVTNTAGFSVYTSYCTGYPRTMERLATLASAAESARLFRERQIALGHPLPLASYLLKPVQRILKYHLLLQNLVKQCASSETEYALAKMTGIAQHIDDMKRKHEHAVRVQEIQSLLYGWAGADLTTYGELCAEGTFRVFGAKGMRHVFLFDKMLLVTKSREDGILAYKSHIMCNNMMLVESIAGAALAFHVIPWDAPRRQLTLHATTRQHKREWTLLLKRVILENYNAVIPSHARQLVMELGQNKTDDDILAEKSHNLITQASMRKQLSAPEYLEKRKLERDRRQAFENGTRGRTKKVNRKYTVPNSKGDVMNECDCAQASIDKGIDLTCDNCFIDLCSDCENELAKTKKDDKCNCKNEDNNEKCPECDRSLHYIDSGSVEHLERKTSVCKCSDFKSSQESFGKEFTNSLTKTRGYHSSDNIVSYADSKSKENLTETNSSMSNMNETPKTCLKCVKIKENIVVNDYSPSDRRRKSRCIDTTIQTNTLRSKSKDDPRRIRMSKIGGWRRKSEPGLQQNSVAIMSKKSQDSDNENPEKGNEKIEFECRNCGSNKISKKHKNNSGVMIFDSDLDNRKRNGANIKPNVEIKMYNTKNVPKKISKLKKNRAKGLRVGTDTTAKFYADLSTDVSTENILHISESTDSLNVDKATNETTTEIISKDEDIDEETYKKLIEKTDSFKKNELEKVKFMNKQKVINEASEDVEERKEDEEATEEEEQEQPLEQIISQLLLQNREFQKLLKKQQQRHSANRRHQRLLKSYSNPEQENPHNSSDLRFKPKFVRQTSENAGNDPDQEVKPLSPPTERNDGSDDDHIYETLRVESRVEEALHHIDNKSKSIQHSSKIARPKRFPSPPGLNHNISSLSKSSNPESDYVYLSFDKLNEDLEGIYDVPIKTPEKVVKKKNENDYYVTVDKPGPSPAEKKSDHYDSLVEVCRRKKDLAPSAAGEYLPMSPEQKSPIAPEIWLSRQKEHFNVSRDRKSGSLPRSFQVPTSEDNNMSTFKSKPSISSKTYLNRDGKVLSTDRPFTIASDQSELSFDDVENYMPDGDVLKLKKGNYKAEESASVISQSTLELEREIDRCYKKNFEGIKIIAKSDNLTISQTNLNTSTTSSCEALSPDRNVNNSKDVEIIHPEHKIYKPTSNLLSLKNVLSRFKSRTPKGNDDGENTNDNSSPDSGKTDLKSPTNEKRSALNPRSYSKNLLQRFKSIIGDEQPDDNQPKLKKVTLDENMTSSDIKVVITPTDPSTAVVVNGDNLSRSVFEPTTFTESQNEKNNLEEISHSCGDLNQKKDNRPAYGKSISMVTTISSSVSSTQTKSNNSSYQSLNKLPVYMQGSKNLGARIAQSDYVDPTTLVAEKSPSRAINVLINRNSVRPDSLFSNSSFVTSSSEGTYQEVKKNGNKNTDAEVRQVHTHCEETTSVQSDESFYEKKFEKIEHITDDDVFRDSAVYSDQEDDDHNTSNNNKSKTVKQSEIVERNSSFKSQKVTVISKPSESKTVIQSRVITKSQTSQVEERKSEANSIAKAKPAPPVPTKPKITNIPTPNLFYNRNSKQTLVNKSQETIDSGTSTVKRNTNLKHSFLLSESSPNPDKVDVNVEAKVDKVDGVNKEPEKENIKLLKPTTSSIQIKRLSFERASLDSATRKIKINNIETKTHDSPKTISKTVLERRMEIESLTKTKPSQIRKPTQLSKPRLTAKVSSTETKDFKQISIDQPNIPSAKEINTDEDPKGSWVKTVVNKFQ